MIAKRPATARPAPEIAAAFPVAQVAVDTGLAHLDRPFDYAVPAAMAADAQPGCRVRVRFSGRLADGVVLARVESSDHAALAPLTAVVSPEPVLSGEVATLARVVADRSSGMFYDVLRLALPPRHARVEAESQDGRRSVGRASRPATKTEPSAAAQTEPSAAPETEPAREADTAPKADTAPEADPAPETQSNAPAWTRYPTGPAFLAALRDGRSPRAVWSALPGPTWPNELAAAVRATTASGRGAVVVVPDHRDLDRLSDALAGLPHAALSAELGPAERYRRWLRVRRGEVKVAIGTRAAAWAPVADLGLVAIWDDGDDLHAEPRAPYVHVRDVLIQRAHLSGAAMLIGGHARTAEAQLLVDSGWAHPVQADRAELRRTAPRVDGTSEADLARDPMAKAARLPAAAFDAARTALAAGAPVLVQVPRRGYVPGLACERDRTPIRCPACAGPVGATEHSTACRWCGRLATDWRCPICAGRRVRATAVGARRTAEELGRAFPGALVRTSGRDEVLASVPAEPALVVATPGAEPVADGGGYGAVLLLDAWSTLSRVDLRAGEEALRRWFAAAALARPQARVVVVADRALPAVQALIRWDPAGAAARELADRTEVGFPPATRMASVEGPPAAVAAFLHDLALPAGGEILGPVPVSEGEERLLLRVRREQGAALAAALKAAQAVRSARKGEPVRVAVDPQALA